jgi:hypothetical protein
MAAGNFRTLALTCVILGSAAISLAQSNLSPSLAPATSNTNNGNLPTFSAGFTASRTTSGADETGASVTNAFALGSLTSVNQQARQDEELTLEDQGAGAHSPYPVAAQSLFGSSSSSAAAGATSLSGSNHASFGVSRSYSVSGQSAGTDTSPPGSIAGNQKGTRAGKPRAENSSGNLSLAASNRASFSLAGSASSLPATARAMKEPATDFAGANLEAADYAAMSFPDSTQGTALLSPPEREGSPVTRLRGELSFSFADLNNKQFMQLSLRAEGAAAAARQQENQYQRFMDRLNTEHSSLSGPAVGLSPSTSSSLLGNRSSYSGSRTAESGGSGLGTGLRPRNPYFANPFSKPATTPF